MCHLPICVCGDGDGDGDGDGVGVGDGDGDGVGVGDGDGDDDDDDDDDDLKQGSFLPQRHQLRFSVSAGNTLSWCFSHSCPPFVL